MMFISNMKHTALIHLSITYHIIKSTQNYSTLIPEFTCTPQTSWYTYSPFAYTWSHLCFMYTAHTTVHTTRGYFPQQQPQQQLYGNPGYTGYGAGVVMTGQAVHTGQSVPPNAPPAQQHPVDSHGVPVAAVYKEPKCGIDNVN